MIELLYAVAIVAGMIAVMEDPQRSGRFVLIIVMIAAIYQLVQMWGMSLWLLIIVVIKAAVVRVVVEALGVDTDRGDDARLAVTLDQVLTRMQGDEDPPPGGGGTGRQDTGGGGRPRIWGDQDDD